MADALPDLRPLEGKYEIVRKLREGGMGAIYLVRHRLLDELRVIKVMRPSIQDEAEFRARFLREAKTATQLKHRNVAQVYDFAIDEQGAAYMVLEFIKGRTFQDLIAEPAFRSLRLKVEMATQALRALGFLHKKGFVHRDIAPDNLMLTSDEDGRPLVKLLDLGIVKVTKADDGGRTGTSIFLGKWRYASPEQFETSQVDARSDLYSFGVLFYELLTGTYPIVGSDMRSIMAGNIMKPPVPFETSDPEGTIPAELRAIVLAALEKAPERRLPNAEEFGRRLGALRLPEEKDEPLTLLSAEAVNFLAHPTAVGSDTQERLDAHFVAADATPTATQKPFAPRPVEEADARLASAERSLSSGDLATAEREAKAALAAERIAPAQRERAEGVLRQVTTGRCKTLLGEAQVAFETGETQAAIGRLNDVLRLDPKYAPAHALLARVSQRFENEAVAGRTEATRRAALEPPHVLAPPAPAPAAASAAIPVAVTPRKIEPREVESPPVEERPRRNRWPLAAGAAAIVVVGLGIALWPGRGPAPQPAATNPPPAASVPPVAVGAPATASPAASRPPSPTVVPTTAAVHPPAASTAVPAPAGPAGPAAVAAARGFLVIDAAPWARVERVAARDGTSVELPPDRFTPLRLELPAGQYQVVLAHPGLGRRRLLTEVRDGEVTRLGATLASDLESAFLAGH